MSKDLQRTLAEYWVSRVFRPGFTYRGARRQVPAWCIKVQWKGRRRTLRLNSADREAAAAEAAAWYGVLQEGGWAAIDRLRTAGSREAAARPGMALDLPWVAPRKYVSSLRPGFTRELFAALHRDGVTEHVPLYTEDANLGRLRAQELHAELQRDGWSAFRLAHAREVTVAVFWMANPMTCTYTTLLTRPAREGERPLEDAAGRGWRCLVVEPEGGVRRALVHWLAGSVGIRQVDAVPLADHVPAGAEWDLVLVSRDQPVTDLRTRLGREGRWHPLVLHHGTFADSDAIFASVSGVTRGYLLQRLPPGSLLLPLLNAFPDGPPRQRTELDRQVRRYFQGIFDAGDTPVPDVPGLTPREQDILDLLSRGFADKEVAHHLGISVWTVHSHLKRIFVKFGVRTRTEAVVRHLQK